MLAILIAVALGDGAICHAPPCGSGFLELRDGAEVRCCPVAMGMARGQGSVSFGSSLSPDLVVNARAMDQGAWCSSSQTLRALGSTALTCARFGLRDTPSAEPETFLVALRVGQGGGILATTTAKSKRWLRCERALARTAETLARPTPQTCTVELTVRARLAGDGDDAVLVNGKPLPVGAPRSEGETSSGDVRDACSP